jgi:hypothetical protein
VPPEPQHQQAQPALREGRRVGADVVLEGVSGGLAGESRKQVTDTEDDGCAWGEWQVVTCGGVQGCTGRSALLQG